MASHIILPKEEEEEEEELAVAVEADHDSPEPPRYRHAQPAQKALPFSATCVRISRDSYPNLRALRNASATSLRDDDAAFAKLDEGDYGYVLDDVQHLTDYLPELPTFPNPLQDHPAYSTVKQYFVNADDTVPETVVVQKNSPRGVHFRRAGPRQRVYFEPEDVKACIVTCGGLCPGLNTVIRELVCGLSHMYNVNDVFGIQNGYKGFYSSNYLPMTPKSVNDIHKRGGTVLGSSRGGHDTHKIVDNIQDRGINQVYIIGGDGTQKGAYEIFKEIRRRGLKVAVAGIPKTIDNDIAVIDKSFGFDSAVEEAQRAIDAAHVEASSAENGIGLVKLMGRYSGLIAMYATLASRDVDCCLIPESPFYLEGKGGLFEYIERRLKENNHMVIVVAEGAGQDLIAKSIPVADQLDASGNKLLLDVGLWLTHKIKDYCKSKKMEMTIKYIDPTYMIRAIPSNASDNVYCTLLAHSAIHGAMAGYSFTVGMVHGRHAYIPFHRVTSTRNKVKITDRMWARLLSSTNQPSFLSEEDIIEAREAERLANRLSLSVPAGSSEHAKKYYASALSNGSGDAQETPTLTLSTLHQPSAAITVAAPSSSATAGTDSVTVTVIDSDEDDSDATGPREETAERETGAWQEAEPEEADRKWVERPMQPETPERMAPPPGTALLARADETVAQAAQNVDAFNPGDGCTTPSPPPAHGSGDDRVAASTSGQRAGVAAARSRLLAFRSFAGGKKGNKSQNSAPGEHLPADGEPWEKAVAGDKEKGRPRWKRFWK